MKRINFLIIALISTVALNAQDFVMPNRPKAILDSRSGYITFNELNGGIGLGAINVPFSKYFFGFTTIHGYQVNKDFVTCGGTGILFYNEGTLVPLFLDFRFNLRINTFTPYLMADGGMLLNFSNINSTRLFINPAIGVRYSLSVKLAATFSTGFWMQQGGGNRDSFIPFRAGIVYKPR